MIDKRHSRRKCRVCGDKILFRSKAAKECVFCAFQNNPARYWTLRRYMHWFPEKALNMEDHTCVLQRAKEPIVD